MKIRLIALPILALGGFALTGFTTSKGNGAADLWVVRTDAAGTLLWEKTYGGPGGDEGRAIVEVTGGFALAGATGGSTSGCVRATVVDSLSRSFRTIVPEECVADKHESPHFANLYDMALKYADVLPVQEVIDFMEAYAPRNDR